MKNQTGNDDNKNMNWYSDIKEEITVIAESSFPVKISGKPMTKLAYSSKRHNTEFNDNDANDGYSIKIALTESKSGIVLTANLMSAVYSFPSYSETWKYEKKEATRAFKTYNRCVNVVEDIKVDHEEEELAGPSLQGLMRETLRYIDIDRKKETNNRSLEAAKYQSGETDWNNSIYSGRLNQPIVNINNSGEGTININGL